MRNGPILARSSNLGGNPQTGCQTVEHTFLPAIAAALICSLVAPASALASEETAEMTIRLGGLDLESKAGSVAAFDRIKTSARVFCGGSEGVVSITTRISARRCQDRMIDRAVTKLDAATVTSLRAASIRKTLMVAARR
jgi:UrcA family protein